MEIRVRLDELLPSKEAARELPRALDRLEGGQAEQREPACRRHRGRPSEGGSLSVPMRRRWRTATTVLRCGGAPTPIYPRTRMKRRLGFESLPLGVYARAVRR
jgi:hypothetical protein